MENYLFVSDYPDEWDKEHECIQEGTPLAYVENLDAEECSELGLIGVELTSACGLRRTF